MSPRKKVDVPDVPLVEQAPYDPDVAPNLDGPDIPRDFDVGALLAKDRAGPPRDKYPITEGQANFASMRQRAEDAVASTQEQPK